MDRDMEQCEGKLITLAVVCYNFEKYIAEALDGAFAQTYSPLEILISDDCSTDRTWEIVQAKVAMYHGPHRIKLSRNPVNLGLALHENKIFELAQSDWIVFQSGDDVSMPNRVERVSKEIARNSRLKCIHCRCQIIDENGQIVELPKRIKDREDYKPETFRVPGILGAGAVYHRDIYDVFGPLGSHVLNEDQVLPLRAKLLGEIKFIDEKMVQYRKHLDNLSGNDLIRVAKKEQNAIYRKKIALSYYQELMDLQWLDLQHPEMFNEIIRYRRLIEDNIKIAFYLSTWVLRPRMRGWLFWCLIFSPRMLSLFITRAYYRLIRSLSR